MGVHGLQSFLEIKRKPFRINVDTELNKWKRRNPGQVPTIVIDFMCVVNSIIPNGKDSVCGGRHERVLNAWKKKLDAFKATKCSLVFFSDLNIQEGKIDEWLKRRNSEFSRYSNLYNAIEEKPFSQIKFKQALSSTFYGMAVMAQSYGKFHYSIEHECDLEIAQYANKHNAVAIISNDSDFLIFDGSWSLWSSNGIEVRRTRLKATCLKYGRNDVARNLNLLTYQLPLFATLMGNDITSTHNAALNRFGKKLDPSQNRFQNVARYIRNLGRLKLNDNDIKRIAKDVFRSDDNKYCQLIRTSIDSYNTHFPTATVNDPIESELLHTNMYRLLMETKCSIHGILLPLYDMRVCPVEANLPKLLTDWIKRSNAQTGYNSSNAPAHTFTLLAKKNINEKFLAHTETVAIPDFQLPSLNQIFGFHFGPSPTNEMIEMQWKIFGWITSLTDSVVSLIRLLPKEYMLIGAALYVLVKNGFLDIKAADGILYTENRVYNNAMGNVTHPNALVTAYVRAAHIYNITFSDVRQNFAIAGLLKFIQEALQFDGVYFQKLMEKFVTMNDTEYEQFIAPIQQYRIYAAS